MENISNLFLEITYLEARFPKFLFEWRNIILRFVIKSLRIFILVICMRQCSETRFAPRWNSKTVGNDLIYIFVSEKSLNPTKKGDLCPWEDSAMLKYMQLRRKSKYGETLGRGLHKRWGIESRCQWSLPLNWLLYDKKPNLLRIEWTKYFILNLIFMIKLLNLFLKRYSSFLLSSGMSLYSFSAPRIKFIFPSLY